MKYINLTVLVCAEVAAFAALYQRITGLLVGAILEGLSRM